MIRRIDRVVLRVGNLESALHFYREVMGLRVVRSDARVATLAASEVGGGELVLHMDENLPTEAIYYLVDDVREMHRRRAELKLQFVSAPAPAARGYTAAVKDPFGNVLMLLDRTMEHAAKSEDAVNATTVGGLFGEVEQKVGAKRDLLVKLYEKVGRTADDLPYTPHFESLYGGYVIEMGEPAPTRAEVWRHVLNLRKAGKLPKLGEARSPAPEISDEMRADLRKLLGDDIGRRDRLPYTDRFDAIVDEINRGVKAKKLSPHLVWRLVATMAK